MTKNETSKLKRDFVAQYPNMATRPLANKLLREFPELFTDHEAARSSVRYYRGETGSVHRKIAEKSGSLMETSKYSSPDSAKEDYKPHILQVRGNGLLIGDLHIPYHDKSAVDLAVNYAIKMHATDHLIILGDLIDFYQMSKFGKDPTKRSISGEVDVAGKFLKDMTGIFGEVVYKSGNHEKRLQDYVFRNAPALVGVKGVELPIMLDVAKIGITYVNWDVPIYAGDNLTLVHGHEYGRSMFSPVNAARGLFMKALACSITAHYHRPSHHDEPNIRGKDLSTWSIGCMCQLHPEYARLNKWQHGFGLFNFEGGDEWDFSNHRIVNGRVR